MPAWISLRVTSMIAMAGLPGPVLGEALAVDDSGVVARVRPDELAVAPALGRVDAEGLRERVDLVGVVLDLVRAREAHDRDARAAVREREIRPVLQAMVIEGLRQTAQHLARRETLAGQIERVERVGAGVVELEWQDVLLPHGEALADRRLGDLVVRRARAIRREEAIL